MALDEAILQSVSQALSPPTLRLYSWDPACLSLGYAQPFAEVDPERLRFRDWDIVRRPTGGRAILHTDELTYAIIGLETHPVLGGGVLECYRKLSTALLTGLQKLGAAVRIHSQEQSDSSHPPNPVCFQNPSSYELKFRDRKLLGSAQVRRKGVILQHGSLPLYGDISRICQVLVYPDPAARSAATERVLASAVTLEQTLGRRVAWDEAAQSVVAGFEETLGFQFEVGLVTEFEQEKLAQALRDMYGTETWTRRR